MHTQPPTTRQAKKALTVAGSQGKSGAGKKTLPLPIQQDNSKPEGSISSKISVIISAHEDEDNNNETTAVEDTPRNEAVSTDEEWDKLLPAETKRTCKVSDEARSVQGGLQDTRLDYKEEGTCEATSVPTEDAEDAVMKEEEGTPQDTPNDTEKENNKAMIKIW